MPEIDLTRPHTDFGDEIGGRRNVCGINCTNGRTWIVYGFRPSLCALPTWPRRSSKNSETSARVKACRPSDEHAETVNVSKPIVKQALSKSRKASKTTGRDGLEKPPSTVDSRAIDA